MQLFNLLALGLLTISSADARVAPKERSTRSKSIAARWVESRGPFDWDKPRIKIGKVAEGRDIFADAQSLLKLKPETDELKKISEDDVWIKTGPDVLKELEVYRDIEGQEIAPKMLGLIEKNENADVVGMVLEHFDGKDAEDDDAERCVELLKKLHEFGWSHNDAKPDNFKIKSTLGFKSARVLDFGMSTRLPCDMSDDDKKKAWETDTLLLKDVLGGFRFSEDGDDDTESDDTDEGLFIDMSKKKKNC